MHESIHCRRRESDGHLERQITDAILVELGHTTGTDWSNPLDLIPNPLEAFQKHVVNPLAGPRGPPQPLPATPGRPPVKAPPAQVPGRVPLVPPAGNADKARRDAAVKAMAVAQNKANHNLSDARQKNDVANAKDARALAKWYQTDDSDKKGGLSVQQKLEQQRKKSKFSSGLRR